MRKFLFVAVMLPALASGAVYKCADAAGKITFSDRACAPAEQGGEIEVRDVNSGGSMGLSNNWEQRPRGPRRANRAPAQQGSCRHISDTEVRTLVIKRQVVVGMKTSDAVRAWGTPWRVTGSQHAYFWDTNIGSFFYNDGGCVSSVEGSYRGGKFLK